MGNTWGAGGDHRHARRFRQIGEEKAESEARVVVLPFLRTGASPVHGRVVGKTTASKTPRHTWPALTPHGVSRRKVAGYTLHRGTPGKEPLTGHIRSSN